METESHKLENTFYLVVRLADLLDLCDIIGHIAGSHADGVIRGTPGLEELLEERGLTLLW